MDPFSRLSLDNSYALIYINLYQSVNDVIMVITMESTAKIFKNGRSQAVRLPKEFRLKGTEVKISKKGEQIILEPLEKTEWPRGFWAKFAPDPDFEIPPPLPVTDMNLD